MEFQQIFNVRDLLLVLFLVISGLLGAGHGLIRTFMSLLGLVMNVAG